MSELDPAVTSIGTSVVRTIVPAAVGTVVAAAASAGFDLDPGTIQNALALVVTTAYYAVVRTLETRLGPAYGWLLGVAKQPTYEG